MTLSKRKILLVIKTTASSNVKNIYILFEQLTNVKDTSTEVLKQILGNRENYSIKRLKTLEDFSSIRFNVM